MPGVFHDRMTSGVGVPGGLALEDASENPRFRILGHKQAVLGTELRKCRMPMRKKLHECRDVLKVFLSCV